MSKVTGRFLVRRVGAVVAASASALALLMPSAAQAVPTSVTLPTISGTPELDQTLTVTTGTWTDASPIVRYEYQWQLCLQYECTDIDYAASSTYTLPGSLVGLQVRAVVLATDAEGETGVAASEATDIITFKGTYYAVSEATVGNGSVTGFVSGFVSGLAADANLTCPSACGALYRYVPGTIIELIAKPQPGSTFLGWGGACSGSAPTCSLTLGGDVAVTATFTGHTAPAPALPQRIEGEPAEAQPARGGAPAPEVSIDRRTSSPAGPPARLLGIHEVRRHVQAVVRCQEARTCRLSLSILAGTRGGQALIAQRSFAIAPRRSARIGLVLSRTGERLLAARRRLPVVAQLMLSVGDRAIPLGQGRLTLA